MITTLRLEDGASVQIVHHGAQVVSWIPAGHGEQLFLSKASPLDSGKPLRGGVPVIFPQFSDLGPLPKHGFARNFVWDRRESATGNQAVFELRDSDATRMLWPHAFALELTITLMDRALELELKVQNTGATAFEFTAALHTYVRLEHINDTRIHGLKGTHYRDSVTGTADCVETEDAIGIDRQVDRVYMNAPSTLQVVQRSRHTDIVSTGFMDAVLWNPWRALSDAMTDMEPGGYEQMVCVESATVAQPVSVQPGGVWRGSQRLLVIG
jgi:glucose-6-phosphate 1-epimerase